MEIRLTLPVLRLLFAQVDQVEKLVSQNWTSQTEIELKQKQKLTTTTTYILLYYSEEKDSKKQSVKASTILLNMILSRDIVKSITFLLFILPFGSSSQNLRRQQATCTQSFTEWSANMVDEDALDGNAKNWLVNAQGNSFISELFDLYVNEHMISASGAEILDG